MIPATRTRVLVIDEEPDTARLVAEALGEAYETTSSAGGGEALERYAAAPFDLTLMEVRLKDLGGVETLERLRRLDPSALVVMLSSYDHVGTAVQCMRLGAHDYLTKPLAPQELRVNVELALRRRRLSGEVDRLRRDAEKARGMDRLVGESPAMRALKELIARIAAHDISVLVTGESGTGKELVAESLHLLSHRRGAPYVSVDCAALPENLIESELFGHEKGAFTDAKDRKVGRFELANGGVLFLDEIGNLPLGVQVKLLRVLQERRVRRLGASSDSPIDVRLVTATNVDLAAAMRQGRFREDLYFRLNEFHVQVPPLRERSGDIPLLAGYFLHGYNRAFGRQVTGFNAEAAALLEAYAWPGNVRELQNAVKRAVILSGEEIAPEHLPRELKPGPGDSRTLKEVAEAAVSSAEAEMIRMALEKSHWNKQKAAQMLEIDYKTLFNKLKAYNIA